MTDRFILEGDMIRHVRETLVAEAPISALRDHLSVAIPTLFPVLPSTPVRALGLNPTSRLGFALLEHKPRHHRIRVEQYDNIYPDDEERNDEDGIATFNVLFPWTYFGMQFSLAPEGRDALSQFTVRAVQLFYAKQRIESDDDRLWDAACPNVDEMATICWGDTVSPQNTLATHMDTLVNEFFVTTFNQDLGHRTPFGTSMTDWENHSADLTSFLDWPFWEDRASRSLKDILTERLEAEVTANPATVNNAFVALPPLPENFSVGRAQEWIDSLNPDAQARLTTAILRRQEVPA